MNHVEVHSPALHSNTSQKKVANGALIAAVVDLSVADGWAEAVGEWDVAGLEELPEISGVCVCGNVGLKFLFTIHNRHTAAQLHPIGSDCIHLFGHGDMTDRVKALRGLLTLRAAIRAGENISLASKCLTAKVLETLCQDGAFHPDKYNGWDGKGDLEFLLKMFNKRDKSDISVKQQNKIDVLLARKIIPFVLGDARLK
jgi:hypothetical protein